MGSWKLLRQNLSVLGRKLALVIIGSAVLTFGIHNIHEVVGITEGGVIGALLLANHWLGVPASIASPILDILCYAFALRLLGVGFLGWSVVSSAAIAAFYALWERLPNMVPDLTALPLAAAILGGIFVGVGAGLVVRGGGSAGGDDALALSIQKLSGWKLARCYLVSDLSVLLLSLSYIPVSKIAFSLITVMISSPLIDKIVSWRAEENSVNAVAEA
ncbi:YitT family protein [Collinsella tanakaei]|uniref:YitT family protein n=1 Tax=Collinsella tanakaei TaxID=626935 RepID=UPI00195B396D|nr:YitT family protein [Collinsella tanakaei]MBM6777976.1 YitT family protein [Collinsella tanakaei]